MDIIRGHFMKNVLWTGGWDSTFRVLDLVLNKKEEVQPYYVIDKERPSVPFEIKAMDKIREMVAEKDSNVANLIRDYIMIEIDKIPENEKVTCSYNNLRSMTHLGNQYDFLARYVCSMDINNIELSIHKDDKAEMFIRNDVQIIEKENDSYYVMKEELSIPDLCIFSYYHFPLLDLTKLEMAEISKRSGFDNILEETWFCYTPTNEGIPCGLCNPCKYTKEEGLGRRIPKITLKRKIRLFLGRTKSKVYKVLKLV